MNQHAKRRQQAAARAKPEAPAPKAAVAASPLPALETASGSFAFEADATTAGARLDKFLSDSLLALGKSLSRTRLKALIETECVWLDGEAARDAAQKMREGQKVELRIPEAAAAIPVGENIPLTILFEDDSLVVLDKPAGLVVHPAAGHETGTLVNALIAHCGESLSGVGGVKRPGVVHRLDKDTSGVMVVAKNDAAHRGLAELFADHGRTLGLVREYLAVVWGAPNRGAGLVDAPIGRHPYQREKQAIVRSGGREAMTHWRIERILGATGDKKRPPAAALIRCRLETGRTHQIRVHMASIGHPLVGDALYGAGFKTKAQKLSDGARAAVEALGRQALHATSLAFPHPITGEELTFETPPPQDMLRLIAAIEDERAS